MFFKLNPKTDTKMKIENLSQKQMNKIVELNGFTIIRRKNSHVIWMRGSEKITLVDGGNKHGTNPMIFRRLIKEYKLNINVL